MKMLHVHTYFDEAEVQASLKGQLDPKIHFENQCILFRDLRSPGILRCVCWQLSTDVSGQVINTILHRQASTV